MIEDGGNELLGGEGAGLALVVAVVGVAQDDLGVVGVDDLAVADRAALDVAGDIGGDTFAVGVALAEVDVPLDLVPQPREQPVAAAG